MASITDIPAGRSVRSALANLGMVVTDAVVAMGRARARCDEIEALMALSDEDLAAKGLKREEIVRHVFRDRIEF
ncbi:MAG: DUF1127 domain-containing protein [Pseudomonadota bacterium]